jgi:predicted nucleic acid-binding protein
LLDEEFVDETLDLFDAHYSGKIELFVPAIAFLETASAILKAVRSSRLSPDSAEQAIDTIPHLQLQVFDPGSGSADLARRSYAVAQRIERSIYDASFLVVSQLLEAPLITADRRLFEAAKADYGTIWLPNMDLQ